MSRKRLLFSLFLILFHFAMPHSRWAQETNASRHSLTDEINRLKAYEPDLFQQREAIHELLPNENYFDILFLATRYCKNDLQILKQEFPVIYTVFHPSIIEDLDSDGTEELVINLSGYLSGDSTWFQVLKNQNENFEVFEYQIEGPMMDVIPGTYERKKNIILTRTGVRKIQIKGKNELISLEYIEEMVLGFNGKTIEVVSPRRIVHEQVIINNLP
jgi:hypothetical protein